MMISLINDKNDFCIDTTFALEFTNLYNKYNNPLEASNKPYLKP